MTWWTSLTRWAPSLCVERRQSCSGSPRFLSTQRVVLFPTFNGLKRPVFWCPPRLLLPQNFNDSMNSACLVASSNDLMNLITNRRSETKDLLPSDFVSHRLESCFDLKGFLVTVASCPWWSPRLGLCPVDDSVRLISDCAFTNSMTWPPVSLFFFQGLPGLDDSP